MIDKKVKKALDKSGVDYEIREFPNDFKSSEDAAVLIGIKMDHIAKTLVYQLPIGICVLILAGNARIDSEKYKKKFKVPLHRVDEEDLMDFTGFVPGAVSPIGIAYKRAKVYMDESLRPCMDEFVYPSGGTLNSAIGIKVADLFKVCGCKEWIDISEV